MEMNRRTFIGKAALATAAGSLALSAEGAVEESALRMEESTTDTVEFSKEELHRMFNNGKFPPRPDAPCPLRKSSSIKNVRPTYRYRAYGSVTTADTWVTAWAPDGNLYSSYADGALRRSGVVCHIDGVDDWYYPPPSVGFYAVPDRVFGWGSAEYPPKFLNIRKNPTARTISGNAIITGDDPFDLDIQALPSTELTLTGYPSCYPSGNLVKDDLWFCACRYTSHLVDKRGNQQCFSNGPNRFRISRDRGKTWEWSPFDEYDPIIPELGAQTGHAPLKYGNVHFVDFGKNMEHSPDGYAYLVGHGTCDPEGMSNWSTGDAVFLARVMPTSEAINSKTSYQYFAGLKSDGTPSWSKTFAEVKPVFQWASRCGLTYITYFPAIKKYIAVLCAGWPNGAGSQRDTWIAEADALWGPWSMVTYWDAFGEGAYFAQIPSKFVKPDGRFVMFYAGGWPGPKPIPKELQKEPTLIDYPKATYGLCVAEFQLEMS